MTSALSTRPALALLSLVAVATLSACGAGNSQPEAAASSTPAPASSAPTQAPTASPEATPTDAGIETHDDKRCTAAQMQPAIVERSESYGSTYVDLSFTNEGEECWIDSFPEISFVTGGLSVGPGAARDGEDPGNVYTVSTGAAVHARLTAESTQGLEECAPTDIDSIDIGIPGGGGVTALPLDLRICERITSVAVTPFEPVNN